MFKGFDGLPAPEKMEVLRRAVPSISAVSQSVSPPAPRPAPAAKRPPALRGAIDSVKGVGYKFSSILAKKNIHTVMDALFHFPLRYEDRREIKGVSSAVADSWQTVSGRVESAGRTRPGPGAQFRVVLTEGGSALDLVWFHFDERYMRERYKKGKLVIVSGDIGVDFRRGSLQILHPAPDRIEVLDKEDEARGSIHIDRIVPVYSLTGGLGQRRLRTIMKNVSDSSSLLDGIMPGDCAEGLVPLPEAVGEMHFPEKTDNCPDFSRAAWDAGGKDRTLPAPKTVAFFEFFIHRLAMEMKKRERRDGGGISFKPEDKHYRRFFDGLPFSLTDSQSDALSFIKERMESPLPMNALLQGDVGSGKTVIALLAIMKALDSGYQAALMAPTQILAEQHARFISERTQGAGLKTVVLKGGDSGADFESAANGEADIVVGTHALIYDRVKFKRLGFVVVDEQHKFGVAQRDRLVDKGRSPDILVMTATPIPRSLAMTVYGDLEVVTVRGLPEGRKEVKTVILGSSPPDRRRMIKAMKTEIDAGRRCYVVCPLIDPEGGGGEDGSEGVAGVFDTASALRKDLSGARVAVLHGKMPAQEKDSVMLDFQNGGTDVLVSTTVVEVGIDVPDATVAVIENADRFGLSQIHQLRGRVGRGEHKSLCILLKSPGISEEGLRRLEVLSKNPDGFSIAETDLEMRGPGEFLGTKQSGAAKFHFADLVMDTAVLTQAQASAKEILKSDPELEKHPALKKLSLEILRGLPDEGRDYPSTSKDSGSSTSSLRRTRN